MVRPDEGGDLYALAAIAYRWLTGRPVCSAENARATLYQVVHAAPIRPSSLAELPADVDAVFAIGLAKDPAHRFDHVVELRRGLAAALAGALDPALRERAAQIAQPWS